MLVHQSNELWRTHAEAVKARACETFEERTVSGYILHERHVKDENSS